MAVCTLRVGLGVKGGLVVVGLVGYKVCLVAIGQRICLLVRSICMGISERGQYYEVYGI